MADDYSKKPCWHKDLCMALFHHDGEKCSEIDRWECPLADKIEDHLMEARDMEREFQDEDEIPFCEDYDGPEVE